MIIFSQTRIFSSIERPVASGQTISQEGQALIADTTGGVFGVKASGGSSGELFAGVSMSQQMTPLYLPAKEQFTVPSGLTFTLGKVPAASTIYAYNVTAGSALTVTGSAPSAGEIQVNTTSGLCTFNAAQSGAVVWVTYRYSPTTVEIMSVQGNIPPGGAASATTGTIGVITEGDIVTTEFDTAVNWAAANVVIKTGASGLFTIGGNGATVNGHVTQVPSVDSPYLGIHINA